MYSVFRSKHEMWRSLFIPALLALAACSLSRAEAVKTAAPGVIRVCFDENDLPYSNASGQGFENKLAELIGRELGERIESVWYSPRHGVVTHTFKENRCDVLMETSPGTGGTLSTQPYFRSSYVFVSRKNSSHNIRTLHDPALRKLRIGAQMLNDDFSPPVQVLTREGLRGNFVGYALYGRHDDQRAQAKIVDAVARGDVDIAIVWGPAAGYFMRQEKVPLQLNPIPQEQDSSDIPMAFDVCIGVTPRRPDLRQQIDTVLKNHRDQVRGLLADFGFPLLPKEDTPYAPEK